MKMKSELQSILKEPAGIFQHIGDYGAILGTTGGVGLNLRDHKFPGWSTPAERKEAAKEILPVLYSLPQFEWQFRAELPELTKRERYLFFERTQLSETMMTRGEGVHMLINKGQDTVCHVNDEEHILIQSFFPGAQSVGPALDTMSKLINTLTLSLQVAYSPAFGFMTSDPTRSGEGIFFSTLMYMPGLGMTGNIQKVSNAVAELGIFVTPVFSSSGIPLGDLYFVHAPDIMLNELGSVIKSFAVALEDLAEKEMNARTSLLEQPDTLEQLKSKVAESYKTLTKSKKITFYDTIAALSVLRLGLFCNLLTAEASKEEAQKLLSEAYFWTTPARMDYALDVKSAPKRRSERAAYMRTLITEKLRIAPPES